MTEDGRDAVAALDENIEAFKSWEKAAPLLTTMVSLNASLTSV